MACASCGAERISDSKFCGQCGTAVETITQVMSTSPTFIQQQPRTKAKTGERGIRLRIAFVLMWAAFHVFTRTGFNAEAVGEWVGTLIVPFLLAYLIARGWRRSNSVAFSYWFLGLGLVFTTLVQHNSLSKLSHKDLTKEFLGTKSLEQNLPKSELEMATMARDFFSDIRAWRKTHDEEAALIAPALATLYTNESFSTRAKMKNAREAVLKRQRLDDETSKMFAEWPQSIRLRLDKSELNSASKEIFFKAFMQRFATSEYLAARRDAMSVETMWTSSTLDLYGFAFQHISQVVVGKNGIAIRNDAVREQFNSKLTKARTLHEELIAASQKVDDVRSAQLKRYDLSPADLDLQK